MRRAKWLLLVGVAVVILFLLAASGYLDRFFKRIPSSDWGKFSGSPKSEWLPEGRKMKLLEDFSYVDPSGKTWLAPKDVVVDGASIPWEFWSVTGGPLEGQFRNASIVHDVACDQMNESWEDVHTMFYHACRCGGVPPIQAQTLFWAVYHGGPRWVIKTVMESRTRTKSDGKTLIEPVARTVRERIHVPPPSAKDREKLEKYIREHKPSIDELKKLDAKRL